MENEVIKSYKGFNKDMTCNGFQYEEGKEYETDKAEACKCGFHACEYPLDTFSYYNPAESIFHEVEQSGHLSREDNDSKVASTKIKIGASINIAGIVKAAIEYTTKRVKKESEDKNAVAVAWGYKSKAKGVLGSYLVFGDWEGNEKRYWVQDEWTLKGAKMVQVDGKKNQRKYMVHN